MHDWKFSRQSGRGWYIASLRGGTLILAAFRVIYLRCFFLTHWLYAEFLCDLPGVTLNDTPHPPYWVISSLVPILATRMKIFQDFSKALPNLGWVIVKLNSHSLNLTMYVHWYDFSPRFRDLTDFSVVISTCANRKVYLSCFFKVYNSPF